MSLKVVHGMFFSCVTPGRGKFVNHKGKHRSFTNPDELEEQRKREEKERQWRVSIL